MAADRGLEQLREEEALVIEVEEAREGLRAAARERLGVTGSSAGMQTLREVVRMPGVAAYPVFALGVLAIVDTFQGYAFSVLTPEITFGPNRPDGPGAVRDTAYDMDCECFVFTSPTNHPLP